MAVLSIREISHWNAVIIEDTPAPLEIRPSGIITDLDCPVISREFDTTKRAGELGEVPRTKYFKATEMSFTVKNLYGDFVASLLKGLNTPFTLKATACIEADDGTVTPYIVSGKGLISELPLGSLSADGLESEVIMMCYQVSMSLGTVTMEFDPRNYILSRNGVNLFAGVKSVLYPTDT